MKPPVDFAIITALKVEREAVVRRLADTKKVQIDGEPLTYYTGTVSIPGDAQAYTVVVVQLIDMGNTDAAVATTQVLARWKPRNLLMVGIAGGLQGKVRLGDVVVARHSCYYELAKLKPGDTEYRPKQFHADQMLLARAQHYEEADWKSHIDVGRPGDETDRPMPDVHVEPIACGEKVVADPDSLANIARVCPKMVALAMEGAGAGRAVSSVDHPPRYLEIRGISDYAGPDKNDGWHEYAANAAAAFAVGFLKSRPVAPGPPPEEKGAGVAAPTLVLSVQSLRTIDVAEVLPALGPAERHGELEFLPVDLTDLAVSRAIRDPEEAARRIAGSRGPLLAALARRSDARLVFHGLASIPPVILAGHVVSDRRPVALLDYHPELSSWAWPESGGQFPPLQAAGVPKRPVKEPCEVIVRISVSYPVLAANTTVVVPDARVEIDLAVPEPARSIVRSEEQTRAYGRAFRAVLDSLCKFVPNCRRVHVFYAGPVALAFHIGQQVSENIHPPVVAWNFSRAYDWAIDLAAATAGEPCVLRAAASTGETA